MPRTTILYADDNGALLLALKDLFELEGWGVETCADGAAAMREIEGSRPFALLLLDHEMPGPGGLELLRRARSLPHRRETPAVVISASDVGTEALSAGADAFLKKPDDIDKVVATVARLLKSSRQ